MINKCYVMLWGHSGQSFVFIHSFIHIMYPCRNFLFAPSSTNSYEFSTFTGIRDAFAEYLKTRSVALDRENEACVAVEQQISMVTLAIQSAYSILSEDEYFRWFNCTQQVRMYYRSGTARTSGRCCIGAWQMLRVHSPDTRWQHFSLWKDVMATILKLSELGRDSVNRCVSTLKYCQISPRSDLKRRNLRLFLKRSPQQEEEQQQDDMNSVPGLKMHCTKVQPKLVRENCCEFSRTSLGCTFVVWITCVAWCQKLCQIVRY